MRQLRRQRHRERQLVLWDTEGTPLSISRGPQRGPKGCQGRLANAQGQHACVVRKGHTRKHRCVCGLYWHEEMTGLHVEEPMPVVDA